MKKLFLPTKIYIRICYFISNSSFLEKELPAHQYVIAFTNETIAIILEELVIKTFTKDRLS